MWVPRITRMMGGPLACPAMDSADMRAGATFRMTKRQDAAVAVPNEIQAMIEKGMMDKTTAGMNGTNEYPYKASHSASCRAFMLMQQVVVIHRTVGKPKTKVMRTEAACNK